MNATVSRLLQAEWLQHPDTQRIFTMLDGPQGRTRAVGGVVRDTILDRLTDRTDIDLATELLPAEVMERAGRAGISAYPTGIEHGTVTLRIGDLVVEVTTLRQDIATDGRHAVVQFGLDWHADASRRDFTLNALYADMEGTVFDPLEGLSDCYNQRVRFIGDAAERIREDGLRVYRFFRFSASHGQQLFDEAGLTACAEAANQLGHLSAERVGSEMVKLLSLPRIALTLSHMDRIGLIDFGAGAIAALTGYERQAGEGLYPARLAILLHHRAPEQVQRAWRLANADISAALGVRAAANLLVKLSVAEAAYRFGDVLPIALDVAAAEAGWSEAAKSALLEQLQAVHAAPLPISGRDLIAAGLAPGPQLGLALSRAETHWIDSSFAMAPDDLLALVMERGRAADA